MNAPQPTPAKFEAWKERTIGKYQAFAAAHSGPVWRAATPDNIDLLILGAAACDDSDSVAHLMTARFPRARRVAPISLSYIKSLAAASADPGASRRELLPAAAVSIPATSPFSRAYNYTTEPTSFVTLSSASWVPGWDYIVAADGAVIHDIGYLPITGANAERPHLIVTNLGMIGYYAPVQRVHVDADALYLSAPVVNHFGHFLIDFLPRLMGRAWAPAGVKIVVPADISQKLVDILSCFGVSEDALLRCTDNSIYTFRALHIYQPGRSMPPNPQHVAFVRKHISRCADRPRPGRRFFLSRSGVGNRLVHDAAEVDAVLSAFHFETVDPEKLSLVEEQALFADAEILMGAFGSSLFALYFAPPGCTVIGIVDDPDIDPTIPHTCAMLGMTHQFFESESAGVSAQARLRKDRDHIVDCARLAERLRNLTAGS